MLNSSIVTDLIQPSPEVLTPDEAALYLRVDRETIYRKLRAGKLPGNKVGQQWRIRKPDLDHYLQGPRG